MKVLSMFIFSLLSFWESDNTVNLEETGPATVICFAHIGGEHCEEFDDGYNCYIWIFDEGDGETHAFGSDCGEEVP